MGLCCHRNHCGRLGWWQGCSPTTSLEAICDTVWRTAISLCYLLKMKYSRDVWSNYCTLLHIFSIILKQWKKNKHAVVVHLMSASVSLWISCTTTKKWPCFFHCLIILHICKCRTLGNPWPNGAQQPTTESNLNAISVKLLTCWKDEDMLREHNVFSSQACQRNIDGQAMCFHKLNGGRGHCSVDVDQRWLRG